MTLGGEDEDDDAPMPVFRSLPADDDAPMPAFRSLPADESGAEPAFRNMVVMDHEDTEPQFQPMSADADGIPPPPSYANGDPVPQHLRRDVYRDRPRQE
jgi:hypothetical protein